jgi:hypothetical protein
MLVASKRDKTIYPWRGLMEIIEVCIFPRGETLYLIMIKVHLVLRKADHMSFVVAL